MSKKTTQTNKIFLSIIIPVYNESKRINNLIEVIKYFKNQPFKSEIIIVNDGSSDATLKKLKEYRKKSNISIISYAKNKGKGFAIKSGMVSAKGNYHLFFDIDLSTPLVELNKFVPYLTKFDVVIGTRKTKQGNLIKRQPILRESMGKAFTKISQIFLQSNVTDFTCGFKCFSQKASKEIFPSMKIQRWGFDSEVIFLAQKKRFKIKEVSVAWKNDPLTKVRFPQDIYNSLKELLLIRWYNFQGFYD